MPDERDHRVIGKQLGLFMQHEWAPGAFFWLPTGLTLYETLSTAMRRLLIANDYIEVRTPLIFNKNLWEKSGHWDKYKENMFLFESEKETFSLKPMNCPSHMLIFKNTKRSYRDLPLRIHDQGVLHRNELSGALGGLTRTRQFSQDDAHIFIEEKQIQEEIEKLFDLIKIVYGAFELPYKAKLSTRPANAIGDPALWTLAELALEAVLRASGMEYTVAEGDGAFYGPKIDFDVTDAPGRTWQCATIQLDFVLPRRFDLSYVGEDNKDDHVPVVIHRAIFGSFERFIALLLEHYAGVLPAWLSPTQVRICTVTSDVEDYAQTIADMLEGAGLRVAMDLRAETLGFKIRDAEMQKVPFIAVIGGREKDGKMVTIRRRGGEAEMRLVTPTSAVDTIVQESKPAF